MSDARGGNVPIPANGTITPEQAVQARRANHDRQPVALTVDVMTQRSADSLAMLDYWDLADALCDGYKAIRDAGETYLPKFASEDRDEYNERLALTKFTNVWLDMTESLANKPFEKEVSLVASEDDDETTIPTTIADFTENVDGSGMNLTGFAALVFFNGIASATHWIMIDYPKADPTIRTRSDALRAGIRPFWSHVLGRNVLEARSRVIGGNETLEYIRIYEPGSIDHVRVFERLPSGDVTWTLYVKTDTYDDARKTYYVEEDSGVVSIGVIPVVPFATGRRNGRTHQYTPPMRAAADLQIELYQQESGLKFAKTMAAYAMLTANGVTPDKDAAGNIKKLRVGPKAVLYAPPSKADGKSGSWSFVEPAATSLKFLADDVKDTINQLRELGRQPLTAQSGNLTVITTAVAAGKARSAVQAWALALKNSLENALVITAKWLNVTYDPQVYVFTEFDSGLNAATDLPALSTMAKDGVISRRQLANEAVRRGALGPEYNWEADQALILAQVPGDGEDTNID